MELTLKFSSVWNFFLIIFSRSKTVLFGQFVLLAIPRFLHNYGQDDNL